MVSGREAAALAVADRAVAFLGHPQNRLVAGYYPLGDELDSQPMLAALAAAGFALCLPEAGRDASRLVFRVWSVGQPLVPGPFGTLHPPAGCPVATPGVVLVPLI